MRRDTTVQLASDGMDSQAFSPLSSAVFHILLALSQGERHGYGIIVDVRQRTGGEVRLGTGTLYTALKRLLGQGLLEQIEGLDEKGDTRLTYRLSPLGAEVLRAEALRLERLVGLARQSEVL